MATAQDFSNLVTRLNTDTNALAAKIDALVAKLSDSGLSAAEETQALADLSAVADRLEVLGADPANPVPNPITPTP